MVAGVGAGQAAQRHQPRYETEIGVCFAGRDQRVHLIPPRPQKQEPQGALTRSSGGLSCCRDDPFGEEPRAGHASFPHTARPARACPARFLMFTMAVTVFSPFLRAAPRFERFMWYVDF